VADGQEAGGRAGGEGDARIDWQGAAS